MAVLVDANGEMGFGAWVGKTSGGTYVALVAGIVANEGISAYTDILGTPSLIGSKQTGSTVHGGGTLSRFAAVMDANDVIHVVAAAGATQTRTIAYNTISDPDGSPAWGTWAAIQASYSESGIPEWWCDIDVDSNNYPHVLYLDAIKTKGTIVPQVIYSNRTSGSWSSPEIINAGLQTDYRYPELTVKASDNFEAAYRNHDNGDYIYKTRTGGTWGSESSHATTGAFPRGILVTTGGTVYRYYTDSSSNLYLNGTDTGLNLNGTAQNLGNAHLYNDTDRYFLYNKYISPGVGELYLALAESDLVQLSPSTFYGCLVAHQYLNHNVVDELLYLYEDGSFDIYADVYSLAARRIFITHV